MYLGGRLLGTAVLRFLRGGAAVEGDDEAVKRDQIKRKELIRKKELTANGGGG